MGRSRTNVDEPYIVADRRGLNYGNAGEIKIN